MQGQSQRYELICTHHKAQRPVFHCATMVVEMRANQSADRMISVGLESGTKLTNPLQGTIAKRLENSRIILEDNSKWHVSVDGSKRVPSPLDCV
jgi:hypothetical protein